MIETFSLRSFVLALPLLVFMATFSIAADGPAPTARQPAITAAAKGEPPVVILSTTPALLVTMDGPPRYALVKAGKPLLLRVVNTRVLLLTNAAGRYFLHLYDGFLEAGGLDGPWRVAENVPREVRAAGKTSSVSGEVDLLKGKPDHKTRKSPSLKNSAIPWIYLSQAPAVLIVTDGTPDFISIEGTGLFYARNTSGDLFCLQGEGTMFLLASGFWFSSASYLGPWELVPDGGLPPDFRDIPPAGVKGRVKSLFGVISSSWGRVSPGRRR